MTRRDEQTKIKCRNANGVEKMLMPSVVRNEAKKSNGFRPVVESKGLSQANKMTSDKFTMEIPTIEQDEKIPAIADETTTPVKNKPGRKPGTKKN